MNKDELESGQRLAGDPVTAVQAPPPPPPPTGAVIGRPATAGAATFTGTRQIKTSSTLSLARADSPVANWVEVGLIVLAAFFFNIGLRVGLATAAAVIGFGVVIVALVCSGRAIRRDALFLLALAALLVPWLAIRSDVELTIVTVAMIGTLLSLAAGLSLKGSLFDSRVRVLVDHLASMPFEWFYGLAMVKRLVKATSSDKQGAALLRGLAVAVPVLIIFALLLASADEVFARFLLIGNIGDVFGHLVLTAIVAVVPLSLVGRRVHETAPAEGFANLRKLGQIEVTIVLASVVVLFSAFVATQVVVALGGANHVLETEGLTQADHARRGFFQLLAVAGLSIGLVGLLRAGRVIDPEETEESGVSKEEAAGEEVGAAKRRADRFTPLALMTLALTLVIAGVSVQRLVLYVGSFGLTPDRLWAILVAGAIGLAIVLYAISIAGFRSDRSWYPAATVVVGFLAVLSLNVLNPDATIARYNIEQFGGTAELDVYSLANLSDDATSTIVSRLGDVQNEQVALAEILCSTWDRETSYGILEYNRATVGADGALDGLCGERSNRTNSDGQ